MGTRWVFLLGRLLFGGFFLFSSFNHFMNAEAMGAYAASKGVPMGTLAVLGSGVLLFIGGVSVLLGYLPKVGLGALVLFLVPVTLMMHNFWALDDPQQRMMEMGNFLKNTALLGGALALTAVPEPWPVSVGERDRARRGLSSRRVAP